VVRNGEGFLEDALYDDRVGPTAAPEALLATIERLTGDRIIGGLEMVSGSARIPEGVKTAALSFASPKCHPGGKIGFACTQLPEKQTEAADRKSDAYQAQSRANPSQEGSHGSEIDPWILFSTFIHSPIVLKMLARFDSGRDVWAFTTNGPCDLSLEAFS
jgi:hypothetical protein